MSVRVLAWCVCVGVACKPPPAPEDLDDLAGFLFAHAGDEGDDALQEGLENLDAWMRQNEALLLEDDGYAVARPAEAVVSALGDASPLDPGARLVGAAVGGALRYPSEAVAPLLTTVSPDDLFPDSYLFYDREDLTDAACFADGRCERARQRNHSRARYAGGLFQIEQRNLAELRWVEMGSGLAIVHRTWLTEPVETNFGNAVRIPNQYYLNVVLPDGEGHLRLQATWLVAEVLASNLPEGFALNLVIGSMRGGAEVTEAFYDGELEVSPP